MICLKSRWRFLCASVQFYWACKCKIFYPLVNFLCRLICIWELSGGGVWRIPQHPVHTWPWNAAGLLRFQVWNLAHPSQKAPIRSVFFCFFFKGLFRGTSLGPFSYEYSFFSFFYCQSIQSISMIVFKKLNDDALFPTTISWPVAEPLHQSTRIKPSWSLTVPPWASATSSAASQTIIIIQIESSHGGVSHEFLSFSLTLGVDLETKSIPALPVFETRPQAICAVWKWISGVIPRLVV